MSVHTQQGVGRQIVGTTLRAGRCGAFRGRGRMAALTGSNFKANLAMWEARSYALTPEAQAKK